MMREQDLDLIKKSARERKIRVIIEGHQGTGKTTLALWLQSTFPGLEVKEVQTQPLPTLKEERQ